MPELDRILVHYNIEYTIDLIKSLQSTLGDTLGELHRNNPSTPAGRRVNLEAAILLVQMFNNQCLGGFQTEMDSLLGQLHQANTV